MCGIIENYLAFVDVAPDVIEFNPSPPPILINPDTPATWEPW